MKTLLTAFICSFALAAGAFAQSPTLTPSVSPQAPSPVASVSAAAALSPAGAGSSLADRIHNKIDKKLKHKGVNFQIGGDEDSADSGKSSGGDIPEAVFPIVGIVFVTLFGAPVLIVAVIIAVYLGATIRAAIASEEAFLRATFGQEYDRYRGGEIGARDESASTRSFAFAQAMANREYRAVGGLLLAVLVLCLKAAYNGMFWRAAETR